jgi:ATP/maltotriose-dependent transcriptional regulator MalT
VRCADELDDPALRFAAAFAEARFSTERGELARAQAALARMEQIATELAQPTLVWQTAFATAGLALLRGDLAAGERLAERAFQLGQDAGQPDAVFIYGAQLAMAGVFRGRGEEIIATVEQSVEAYPRVPAWRAALAAFLCWLDRREEASAILKQAAGDRFEHVLPATTDLTALVLYADVASQTGDSEAAAMLYALIEPWADQVDWNSGLGYGHARLYLGLLAEVRGDHERADEHLVSACEFHETSDMPLWAARGHLGWAEALAARGDAAAAREHAARALELSREYGYGLFEPRAEALLAAESTAGA